MVGSVMMLWLRGAKITREAVPVLVARRYSPQEAGLDETANRDIIRPTLPRQKQEQAAVRVQRAAQRRRSFGGLALEKAPGGWVEAS